MKTPNRYDDYMSRNEQEPECMEWLNNETRNLTITW